MIQATLPAHAPSSYCSPTGNRANRVSGRSWRRPCHVTRLVLGCGDFLLAVVTTLLGGGSGLSAVLGSDLEAAGVQM